MPKSILKLSSAYLPAILWAGLIYVFSGQSSLPGLDISYDYFFKKLAHMFVFGVLYFLIHRAVNYEKTPVQRLKPMNWLIPFAVVLAYASADEMHQIFTPNRHPSPIDVGFDMIGASTAFLTIYRYI